MGYRHIGFFSACRTALAFSSSNVIQLMMISFLLVEVKKRMEKDVNEVTKIARLAKSKAEQLNKDVSFLPSLHLFPANICEVITWIISYGCLYILPSILCCADYPSPECCEQRKARIWQGIRCGSIPDNNHCVRSL